MNIYQFLSKKNSISTTIFYLIPKIFDDWFGVVLIDSYKYLFWFKGKLEWFKHQNLFSINECFFLHKDCLNSAVNCLFRVNVHEFIGAVILVAVRITVKVSIDALFRVAVRVVVKFTPVRNRSLIDLSRNSSKSTKQFYHRRFKLYGLRK